MTTATQLSGSKPQHVNALRATWRRTRQHYQAQAIRFFGILGGLIGGKIAAAILAGQSNPFDGLVTAHDWVMYLVPVVVLAWRQFRPQLGAKQLDAAPGATIVPDQLVTSTGPAAIPAPADPEQPAAGVPPAPSELVNVSDIPTDLY